MGSTHLASAPMLALASPPPPAIPPYLYEDFQIAGDKARMIGTLITKFLGQVPTSGNEALLDSARSVSEYTLSTERIIGCVGPSGAGKSSLIISLLEQEGIAIVDGSGQAVTCFPIWYKQSLPTHTSKFTMECAFPNSAQLDSFLDTLLKEYNEPYQHSSKNLNGEEYKLIEESAAAAGHIFEAAFGRLDGFDLALLDVEDCGDVQGTEIQPLQLLKSWARQLPWPPTSQDGIWTSQIESSEQLQERLAAFRKDGWWPFLEAVNIYLDAPLLKNGIVLVDLPGYHDSNLARVKAARVAQAKCDDLFVVSNITRAIDSDILQRVVQENQKRPEHSKMRLQTITAVCTHSGVLSNLVDLEKHVQNRLALRAAKKELSELRKRDAPHSQFLRAEQVIGDLIMNGRNKKVIGDMHEKYASQLPAGNFAAFCVDNDIYMSDRKRAEISGIEALRIHVASLPAKELFKAQNTFIGPQLHALMSFFESWVASSTPHGMSKTQLLPAPIKLWSFHDEVGAWKKSFLAAFDAEVKEKLQNSAHLICLEAGGIAKRWRRLHHSTSHAVIRRNGTHTTPRWTGNWDQELIAPFESKLGGGWSDLERTLDTSLAQLKQCIGEETRQYVQNCKALGAPEELLQGLAGQQMDLDIHALHAGEDLRRRLGLVQRDAFVSQAGCYVSKHMSSAYVAARQEAGPGSHARRHNILEEHIESNEYVNSFCTDITAAFHRDVDLLADGVLKRIKTAATNIEELVETYQGKRSDIPLFKERPEIGEAAKSLLDVLRKLSARIEELAAPARKAAAAYCESDVADVAQIQPKQEGSQ